MVQIQNDAISLRDYQTEMKSQLYAACEQGARSVMCQMPTGTGKTVVLASIINDYLKEAEHEGNQVLIVAHRIEIINTRLGK